MATREDKIHSAREALHVEDLFGRHVDHADRLAGVVLQLLIVANAGEEEVLVLTPAKGFGGLHLPDHPEHFAPVA